LTKLEKAGLYVKAEKCEFSVPQTSFLGFLVIADGISMEPAKVQAIREWEVPKHIPDVQCFLGFANFYRRFIHKYLQKCELLYSVIRKENAFSWTPEHARIFETLKEAFCSAPILRHFNPALETVVETDASDFAAAGVLSQHFLEPAGSHVLHPVAYYSRNLTPADCNYAVYRVANHNYSTYPARPESLQASRARPRCTLPPAACSPPSALSTMKTHW
jgi:hypothetical protein